MFFGYLFMSLAADIGIGVLLTPMFIIAFTPNISRDGVTATVAGAILILSPLLCMYATIIRALSVFGVRSRFLERESMTGKDILIILAGYAAVLAVFLGAYLGKP